MYDLRSISKSLQDAAREILEAKKPLHPNQQKIDVHEPEKDKITAKDFEMLRKGKKVAEEKMKEKEDEMEDENDMDDEKEDKKKKRMHEARSKKFLAKEDVDVMDDADEILLATPIVVDIKESYMFGDYLLAAKEIVGEDQAIELANYAFNKQDTNLFVEQVTRSDIMSKVATHKAAGHQVSEPKYMTKDGKLHAEYVVTDKETGIRRKYIHHGTSRKVENMGAKGKRDDE
jgi:hypothetical protein